MPKLFIYGTLQKPEIIFELIKRNPETRVAKLSGYARKALKDRGYPGLFTKKDESVLGELIDISSHELSILDEYEGEEYVRITVKALCSNGKNVEAFVYVIQKQWAHIALENDWELKL